MNGTPHPLRRLLLALFTAATLALLLPAGLFAYAILGEAAATWGDFQPPADAWQTSHTILASVTVTDEDGLTDDAAYQYSTDGVHWSDWITQNLLVGGALTTRRTLTITAITLAEDETNYIRYAISDALGTQEISPDQQVRIDTQPPAAPQDLQLTPTGWQTATNPAWTATWTNPTDASGVVAACYKLGRAPAHADDGVCVSGQNIQRIENIQPHSEGGFDVHLWLKDAAGNADITQSAVITDGVQWDKTPPTVFIDAFGPVGAQGWYTDAIHVVINAFDGESGLDKVYYNLDGLGWVEQITDTIDEDGEHVVIGRGVDVAGNSNDSAPRELKLDATPPHTTLYIDGTPNAQGWYETPVTLTLQAQDSTSGVASTQWRLDDGAWQEGNAASIHADGKHRFRYFSVDVARNREAEQEAAIWIDQYPPTTSYAVLSPNGPVNGWYNQPVTITLVAVDEGSGVDQTFYRINNGPWQTGNSFQLTESGDYNIEFYSVDKLGHEEPIASIPGGVHIDTLPPNSPIPWDVNPRHWTNTNEFDLVMALPPNDLSGIAGAYVKIGQPPLSPTDGQWHPGANSVIEGLHAPGEGEFNAYVWLQDNAGNVDHGNYAAWTGPLSLKYDATPPVTQLAIAGDAGENGWYVSPVTITLSPDDALSGPALTMVSIDGSEYISATTLYVDEQEKHVLHYYSRDQAGNQEIARLATLRIDYDAPGKPLDMGVQPYDWTLTNTFTLTWTNPQDLSGVAAAYYRIGSPPQGPRDGVRIPPDGLAADVAAPGEGAWDVYLWLEDRAGNVDETHWAVLRKGLRYDATPPTSTLTILDGVQGQEGWYITPVRVLISPSDDGSGPAGVRYRINDGPWQYAEHEAVILLDATDQFELAYQAVDVAGNREEVKRTRIKVDITSPHVQFRTNDRYQRRNSVPISWEGVDQEAGSGLKSFDVQYRDGRNNAWIWSLQQSGKTSHTFLIPYGHRYFFRVRAYDRAGNVSDWVEMPWGVYVDRLQNGDFAGGEFGVWNYGGPLAADVLRAPGPDGEVINVAQLGSPDYGPNNDLSQPGRVPVGSAAITQTIRIPGPDVFDRPTLTFWYRIRTYDTEFSERYQRLYDTLDVRLKFGGDLSLVFRDGQPYADWLQNEGKELADLGWKLAFAPIPRNMIDETISISIENWNRNDGWFNTWTQVTDVRLWEPYQVFLPQIARGNRASAAQEGSIDDLRTLYDGFLQRAR
ncbi:MAG TPA: fibronectin type III domain-containing protein [Anaerolineae bacterium]|nr:fibronectin type III domain-containing protein [Caldilineae bacterium]HID33857.1 fibronectin type III domain-containing protein [Anaerolineae bacterium]